MNSSPPADADSESFGPYTVERELGGGGYGVAYLVTREFQGGITKRFCLKRIRADLSENATRRAEFHDEARLLTMLDAHPGIVQLIDYFEEDGYANLVMEYVEGVDLARLLKHLRAQSRRLPQHVATYIAAELCSALGYAHALPQQIVHRDLAPANVFLGFDGHVKLGDFGIATFLGRGKHTNTHEVKGRIPYMSPEHFDRPELDSQSDIFSLGAMLYEMLCDRRPFDTEHIAEAVKAITSGRFAPLVKYVPDVDPQLSALVQQMLAPRKSERVHAAAEVRRRLLALPTRPDTRDLLGVLVRQCRAPGPQEPLSTLASNILDAMPDVQAALAVLDPEGSDSHVRGTSPTRAASPSMRPTARGSPAQTRRERPASSTLSERTWLWKGTALVSGLSVAAVALAWLGLRPDSGRRATDPARGPFAAHDEAPAEPGPGVGVRGADEATPSAESATPAPAAAAPAAVAVTAPDDAAPQVPPRELSRGGDGSEPRPPKGRSASLDVLVHNYGWVYVDGRSHGKAPQKGIALKPGMHAVLIMDEETGGKILMRDEVLLRAGEFRTLEYHVTDK